MNFCPSVHLLWNMLKHFTHFALDFAVGDCVTDQFSISSPGAVGSPTICGYNTDQHMIVDSAGTECQTINAFIGDKTTTTRQWDIYVTQVRLHFTSP